MSVYNQVQSYGVVNNPLIDSPYVQQDSSGSDIPPPPENDFFMTLQGDNFGLLSGFDMTLL